MIAFCLLKIFHFFLKKYFLIMKAKSLKIEHVTAFNKSFF